MSGFVLKKERSSVAMWKMCLLAVKRKRKKPKFLGFLSRLYDYPPCNSGGPWFSSGLFKQLLLFAVLLQTEGASIGLALGMCLQR